MATRKPQSNSVEGKIKNFNDIKTVLSYASEQVRNEQPLVVEKLLTYVTQKAPKYWCSNTIGLTIILCRLEAQLENLSIAHNDALSSDLSDDALKRAKLISVSMSGIVQQTDTLSKRLSLTTSQLHGSGVTHISTNANSREVAELAVADLKGKPSVPKTPTSLSDAKAKAKQFLENINE